MSARNIKTPTQDGYADTPTLGQLGHLEEAAAPFPMRSTTTGIWPHKRRLSAQKRAPRPFGATRDLPVLGRAQGGRDGNIVMEDNAIDWTFRPADLQGVKDAFAVYVTGDSMLPKYKNQDLAYVHPTKAPRRGRYVLVETADHMGFIKQFVRWDGSDLVLKQFNPAQEIRLPREKVCRVLLVIGSLDA